jgi:hypothetical protein
VAKSAGKALEIPADFFLQENPHEIRKFLVVFISILLILKLHKLFVTSLFISVKLKKYIKKISQVYYQKKFSNKKKTKKKLIFFSS